jgi:hypothetical protein
MVEIHSLYEGKRSGNVSQCPKEVGGMAAKQGGLASRVIIRRDTGMIL